MYRVGPHYSKSLSIFANSPTQLKFICNPKVNTTFIVIHGHTQSDKNLSCLKHMFLAEVKQDNTHSAFLFKLSYCKQASFLQSIHLVLCFLHFCAYCR